MDSMFPMGWSVLRAGSVLLLTAGLATTAMRRCSASARHAIWTAALLGMALLAVLAAVPAQWLSPAAAFEVPAMQVLVAGSGAAPQSSVAIQWLLTTWLTVSAALLASLVQSHVRVLLLTRRAKPLCEPGRHVRFVESPHGQGPMTWGFLRPVVFLPRDAETWAPDVREAVLKHELAHCQRKDCWWMVLARLIASVFWFQPLAWWALYRINAECERAADDAVLRSGVPAGDYAAWLVRIARTMHGEPAAALAMGRTSEFEGRLNAVLDQRMNRRRLGRAGALALAAAVCLVLVPVAAAQKAKAGDKVYRIGGDVSAPSLIRKVEPQYTGEAQAAKLMGPVLLTLQIDKEGVPQNVTVVKGLSMGLSEQAVEAVKQWRFKPGMKDGKAVRVEANVEVNFRLK